MKAQQKLLIICGPTATGKTELAIKLAKKFNGEILSSDSRQVYKGMDIGTGKDLEVYKRNKVKVWGIDLVKPDYQFNVGEYKKIAQQIIADIWQRNKLPMVAGGTGLYIKALLEPMAYTSIPPDSKLREILRYYDIKKLRGELEKLDKKRWEKMNNSDRNNPRRLIRAIEIAYYFRHSGGSEGRLQNRFWTSQNDVLLIGLNASKEILFKRIEERIKKRLKQGIVEEIKKLLEKSYGWNLTAMSGLGYQEFKPYFERTQNLEEVVRKWQIDEQNYSQRQLVWFAKMPVHWFDITQAGFYTEVENLVWQKLLKT